MNKSKMLEDDKVKAMMSLLDDIKFYPYADETKKRILTSIDKFGITYLINELPEGLSYNEYCMKLDDFIVDLIKKEMK